MPKPFSMPSEPAKLPAIMTGTPTSPLKVKIQIYHGNDIAMGPGKADLLEAIIKRGSISAAGRALGMSYRRCWMLVEVMNRCWAGPLVETAQGGRRGGGARVTDMGREVLRRYRALQGAVDAMQHGEDWAALSRLLGAEKPN